MRIIGILLMIAGAIIASTKKQNNQAENAGNDENKNIDNAVKKEENGTINADLSDDKPLNL